MRFWAPAVAGVALLAAIALLLLAGAPAAADHVYSHRYVIVGRVVDALGEPAMGWTASAAFTGVTVDGTCSLDPLPRPTTDANGDFVLCNHIHGISGGSVTVSGPSSTPTSESLNLNTRKTAIRIQLPVTWPTKDPGAVANFHTQYTVRGRVWQHAPGTNLEGVQVNGVALASEPVSVHMIYNSGTERGETPVTNRYGDYSTTRIPLGATLVDGIVHVTSHGVAVSPSGIALDPFFMVSDVDVIVPATPNPALEWLSQYWWALVAPVAIVAGTWYALPRIRASRKASRDVHRIPGIGRSKAQRLRSAGAGTIERLAAADPKELASATGLSVKETKRLRKKAKEFLEAEAAQAEEPES